MTTRKAQELIEDTNQLKREDSYIKQRIMELNRSIECQYELLKDFELREDSIKQQLYEAESELNEELSTSD